MKTILQLLLVGGLCATASAFEFNRQPAGLIKGARLSYVSSSAIKVGVGYGEVMGSYWEITSSDPLKTTGYTLTDLTPTTNGVFQYIYIDRANSSLPSVAIRNSTSAPVWSDDFMGWYAGNDRCIGALWVKPDGSITLFNCSADDTFNCYCAAPFTNGDISTNYSETHTFDATAYLPVNAYEADLGLMFYWNGTGTRWDNAKAGVGTPSGTMFYDCAAIGAQVTAWVGFPRGDKNVQWLASAQTTAGVKATLTIRGYRIER